MGRGRLTGIGDGAGGLFLEVGRAAFPELRHVEAGVQSGGIGSAAANTVPLSVSSTVTVVRIIDFMIMAVSFR